MSGFTAAFGGTMGVVAAIVFLCILVCGGCMGLATCGKVLEDSEKQNSQKQTP
jgi:hypothetical protein